MNLKKALSQLHWELQQLSRAISALEELERSRSVPPGKTVVMPSQPRRGRPRGSKNKPKPPKPGK